MNGGGRCDACNGPQGQLGYCCRGDGLLTSCSTALTQAMRSEGYWYDHQCIFWTVGNEPPTTPPPTPPPTVAPSAEYSVGDACWQMCPKDVMISGDGRCNNCNGPDGQPGYCCRADGYKSNCQSTFKSEVVAAGHKYQHRCIYGKYGKNFLLG